MESKKMILVVDDDNFIRYSLKRHLTQRGYEVKSLGDGFDVLLVCLYLKPDLIISDIRMPKLDGITLLKGLRNNLETSHIPVIFMSAYATNEIMEQARELGAEFFTVKPFGPNVLDGLLDRIFTRIQARETSLAAAGTEWKS